MGSTLWCAEAGPTEVLGLDWQKNQGVTVVDYAIINQPVDEARMGSMPGTLEDEYGAQREDRTVLGRCPDGAEDELGPGETVSFVVLQVRLSDPGEIGIATGLRLRADSGVAVEPMTLMLCPISMDACDIDSAPEGIGKLSGE
ncbi:hypothetical protein BJH93_02720 [Kocuria polaris]|nr:hypothetical protein [Kocuria polaris]